MKENRFNYIRLCILFISFFFISSLLLFILKSCFNIIVTKDNYVLLSLLDFVISFIGSIIAVLLSGDILKECIKNIIDKFKGKTFEFISYVFIALFIMYAVKYGISIIVVTLDLLLGIETTVSGNQNIINELMASAPAMMIISCIVFAPIEEELIFRGAIGSALKNKKVFVTVSGLIFGLMHITSGLPKPIKFLLYALILLLGVITDRVLLSKKSKRQKTMLLVSTYVITILFYVILYAVCYGSWITFFKGINPSEITGGLIYISMGVYLGVLYAKENNIILNILVHSISNALGVIALLFLM